MSAASLASQRFGFAPNDSLAAARIDAVLAPCDCACGCCRHAIGMRGFSIWELLVCVVVAAALVSMVLTSLASARDQSMTDVSLSNLIFLGVAHETYAADWNGRQLSLTADDLSTYGGNMTAAMANYQAINGQEHPWIYLGNHQATIYGFPPPSSGSATALGNATFSPVEFFGQAQGFGNFRVPNCKAFYVYVGGRFYDEPFYAPADVSVHKSVTWLFELPYNYLPSSVSGGIKWSSYCFSAAARFNPGVMRAPSAGGWQSPFAIPTGFQTPSLAQAAYPHLKTQILEHNWNQDPPSMCNPAFPSNCVPWQFNHGYNSAPAALFYDGSVRLLPNSEVIAADEAILKQTNGVDGLWSRDTPLGALGYFGQHSHDGTIVSHHLLSTDGILGRDTIAP